MRQFSLFRLFPFRSLSYLRLYQPYGIYMSSTAQKLMYENFAESNLLPTSPCDRQVLHWARSWQNCKQLIEHSIHLLNLLCQFLLQKCTLVRHHSCKPCLFGSLIEQPLQADRCYASEAQSWRMAVSIFLITAAKVAPRLRSSPWGIGSCTTEPASGHAMMSVTEMLIGWPLHLLPPDARPV